MRAFAVYTCLLVALTATAQAQPARLADDAVVSPPPSADVEDSRQPSDYLRAAQSALATGRPREAADALEMAQTRMLDRSVPIGQTNHPSDSSTVELISRARRALEAHDRQTCMQLIQSAIQSTSDQGL